MNHPSSTMLSSLLLAASVAWAGTALAAAEWPPNIAYAYDEAMQSSGREIDLAVVVYADRDDRMGGDGPYPSRGFAVVRRNADLTLDRTFNGSGYTVVPILGAHDDARTIAVQPDDRIVVAGNATYPCGATDLRTCGRLFAIVRLTADGALDPTFGRGGKVLIGPLQYYDTALTAVAIRNDGSVDLFDLDNSNPIARLSPDGSLLVSYLGTRIVTSIAAIEFHHVALDRYFVTTDPVEFGALDSGAIEGWERTGFAFGVYDGGDAHAETVPVCRLYGVPAAGLDTHFFGADPAECRELAGGPNGSWLIEDLEAFRVVPADATTGACSTGTHPVYRLWNRRADAGHRYIASRGERDAMVAAGYLAEGYGPDPIAWCAPWP